jgi:hypothetical protein
MTSPEVERGVVLPVGIEPTQCALEERLLSSAEACARPESNQAILSGTQACFRNISGAGCE